MAKFKSVLKILKFLFMAEKLFCHNCTMNHRILEILKDPSTSFHAVNNKLTCAVCTALGPALSHPLSYVKKDLSLVSDTYRHTELDHNQQQSKTNCSHAEKHTVHASH